MNKRLKKFDDTMGVCVDRATELYNEAKGATVICSYCGKLMLKANAGVIYDIAKNELTYNHDECFNLYEHVSNEEPKVKEEPNV